MFLRFSLFKKIQEEVKAKFPSVKFVELKDDSYFDRNDGIVVDVSLFNKCRKEKLE